MHRFRIIPIILGNLGNFCKRFCVLAWNKKKAVPFLTINPYQGKSNGSDAFQKKRSVIVEARNGLILKINDTYIPLHKNEVHRRINLSDYPEGIVDFELIGAMQGTKLSFNNVPAQNDHLKSTQEKELIAV